MTARRRVPMVSLAPADESALAACERAVRRVLTSGWYVRGPELEAFEREFAAFCGAGGAVGVGNGLDALKLTLLALGIGRGDEVLVAAHTAIATWLAVTHTGATPVPIEPRADTMQLDADRLAAAITPRTAAIIPVHLYGMPVEIDRITAIARQAKLAVLEDASQAHGARWHGQRVGTFGTAAAFSLYPTKNLGAAGDAGIVVSDDIALLDRVRMLANYGEAERYRSELLGHNSRLDELQAALLRVQLPQLAERNARRRAHAEAYVAALADDQRILLPLRPPAAEPVWHQFVVRVADRQGVRARLAGAGVETLIHYPRAPHQMPAYGTHPMEPLPITEHLTETVLSLPIAPGLPSDDIAYTAEVLLASAG